MIKVEINSIRANIINNQRVVILREINSNRYLPLWIGEFESESIIVALQNIEMARPLTHDLFINLFSKEDIFPKFIEIYKIENDTFFSKIYYDKNEKEQFIDSRPSDALAIAIRSNVDIYVSEDVMEKNSILIDENSKNLSIFEDFIESLDID
ncbi:MAG: bifunctional nuclease family protein [Dehalococcoidia bacterium]